MGTTRFIPICSASEVRFRCMARSSGELSVSGDNYLNESFGESITDRFDDSKQALHQFQVRWLYSIFQIKLVDRGDLDAVLATFRFVA